MYIAKGKIPLSLYSLEVGGLSLAPAADLVVTVLVPAVVGRVFVREGELVEVSPALDLAALGPTQEGKPLKQLPTTQSTH